MSARGILLALCGAVLTAHGTTLDVTVRHVFDGSPLLLDSLRYENAAGETLSVTRLSYLLSGFALEREEGGWVELPGQVAWLDAEAHRVDARLAAVPAGKYRAVGFDVGLAPEQNDNTDLSKLAPDNPLNPNVNGLHWSWQGGYIFLALEGHYRDAAQVIRGYALHLARDKNRTRINLPVLMDLRHDGTLALDFDLGAMLNAPRPLSFEKDGSATHSRDGDPVAAAMIMNLPAAFRVERFISSLPSISLPSPIKPLYMPVSFTPYPFTMSRTFPIPDLPRDNPLIRERVTLGERLFHDPLLSRDGTVSCSSCHQASSDFSDPRRFSLGVDGRVGTRHAMPLFNLAWKSSFFWDGRAPSIRAQVWTPIQDHAEMDETPARVIEKLTASPAYAPLFTAAFGSPQITQEKVGLAIENFLLTITSYNAKFDRAMRGQEKFTPEEQRGFQLFMTEYEPRTGQYGADCFHCHGGALFTDHQFHNNGLPLAPGDTGRYAITHKEADRGKFATPSLRNLLYTGPYMHDGRFTTLEQVVAHYDHGVVRTPTLDPNLAKHPDDGLKLSPADQQAIVAFLKTLSESAPIQVTKN
ncbi:MAG TPA: MbnP family protein [Chthoniobacteraceae bacterium]|nr:MbnP family protein [Chthoniobacteraceae bacterium]